MDQATVAKMGLALERACRFLPEDGDTVRKRVAERVVHCAKNHTRTLAGLTEAARQAVADLTAGDVEEPSSSPGAVYDIRSDDNVRVDLPTQVSQAHLRDMNDCYAVLTELAG